jgi:hypothetical protein
MKGLQRSLARANPIESPITKLRLSVKAAPVTVANGSSAPGIGTLVLGALPQGNIQVIAAVAYLKFTSADADVIATWEGDFGVGSAPNANATLTGTDVDIVASTPIGPAVSKVTGVTRGISAAPAAVLDNTDGSLEVNLNIMIDDASQSNAVDLTVDGTIDISLVVLNDD